MAPGGGGGRCQVGAATLRSGAGAVGVTGGELDGSVGGRVCRGAAIGVEVKIVWTEP
jgi:hypothetical protein